MPVYPVAASRNRNFGVTPPTYPLLFDLVAYWNLSETSGQRNDSHTNSLHLTDNNTVGNAVGPDGGTAADLLKANTEYFSRASSVLLQATGDFSFAACFYMYTNNWYRSIIYKNFEYEINYFDGIGLRFYMWKNGSTSAFVNGGAAVNNTWHHVVCTYATATGELKMYLNNVLKTPVTLAGGGTNPTNAVMQTRHIEENGRTWDGRLAYMGKWNRVLTATECAWLYNAGAGRNYAAVAAYTG